MLTHSLYAHPLTIYPPLTLCSPSHSMFTLSLYVHPLNLCSPTHYIFPLSIYVHPLTLYSPSHSMFTHSLYILPLTLCSLTHSIRCTKFIGGWRTKQTRNLISQLNRNMLSSLGSFVTWNSSMKNRIKKEKSEKICFKCLTIPKV
jgi:hypothetical protein